MHPTHIPPKNTQLRTRHDDDEEVVVVVVVVTPAPYVTIAVEDPPPPDADDDPPPPPPRAARVLSLQVCSTARALASRRARSSAERGPRGSLASCVSLF